MVPVAEHVKSAPSGVEQNHVVHISIHVQVTHARMKGPVLTFQMTMNVHAQVDGPVKAVKMI